MKSLEHSSGLDMAKCFVAGVIACLSAGAMAAAEENLVPVALHRAEVAPAGAVAFEPLTLGMPLGVGSRMKTGEGGWARLAWGRPGTLAFLIRGDLGITEVRQSAAALPSAAFAPVDSALKATLTNNDAKVVPPPNASDGVSLRLFSGELYAFAERAAVQVKFGNGVLTSRVGRFVVAVEAPDATRVTVDAGRVTLVVAGGRSFNVESGQTVRISGTGAALVVTEPVPADGAAGGRADVIALRTAQAGGLAPIAEGGDGKMMLGQGKGLKEMLPPIAEGPGGPVGSGGVGTGLSSPFDLAGQRNAALPPTTTPRAPLLQAPNPANIVPPVNSPERP